MMRQDLKVWETGVNSEAQKRSKFFLQAQGRFSSKNDLVGGFTEGWSSTGLSWRWGNKDAHT